MACLLSKPRLHKGAAQASAGDSFFLRDSSADFVVVLCLFFSGATKASM